MLSLLNRRVFFKSPQRLSTSLFNSFSTKKGIFVPSKAWPAVTKTGSNCKKCSSLEKNYFCFQHGHLGVKELIDKKSMGRYIPNKSWPAKTKKNEDCKQCLKFTPGFFCHHHKDVPSIVINDKVSFPSHPPLLSTFRTPRAYEIAAISTVASELLSKAASQSVIG